MSARAQASYLRDEKNVSFELVSEEDAVAFLEERGFFFKLKAFAKDFEKYGHKAGEKGAFSPYRGMLRCTRQLRNAAANNGCLPNGPPTMRRAAPTQRSARSSSRTAGWGPDVVAQVGSVRVAMDLSAALIRYNA